MNKKSEPKHDHKKTEQKSEHKAPIVHKRLFSRKDRNEKNVKESLKSKKTSGPVKDTKTSQKRKDSKNILLWIGIGLLAVILIVALIMLFWPNKQQPTSDNQTINTVAATVNGEAIYLQDVQEQYNNLNPVLQQLYSVESLLNKSIDDLLLFQESKKAGISITKETIQKELEAVVTENGLTENQLEEALAKQGMTVDDLKETIEKSMSIRELLNRTILQNITITENQRRIS